HVGPRARAVLGRSPASGFEPALGRRDAQLFRGLSLLHFLGSVKNREVPVPNLFRLVPFNELRSLIPRRNIPFGIEHENRVVLYALHQQLELIFDSPRTLSS